MSVSSEEIKKRFGARVREIMVERGMNITSLADSLGKDRQDIQQIVNGYRNPTLLTIIQLAIALDVQPTEFFQFSIKDFK